jgi:hypothetical protein
MIRLEMLYCGLLIWLAQGCLLAAEKMNAAGRALSTSAAIRFGAIRKRL